MVDGDVYLTYRVRRPLHAGRGVSTVVARSPTGSTSSTVSEVWRDCFGAESFERPVVLRTPEGTWRLYVSCATPDSKHWWIEAVDADRPEDFATGRRTVVLPGSDTVAVKDPVIVVDDAGGWHAWICEHPLTEAGHEDRMSTAYHTQRRRTDLAAARHRPRPASRRLGRPRCAGQRRGRASTRSSCCTTVAPRAEDNWHETTGVARAVTAGDPGSVLVADDAEPLRSPYSDGACRYATSVTDARRHRCATTSRLARPDGAHDLVTITGLTPG